MDGLTRSQADYATEAVLICQQLHQRGISGRDYIECFYQAKGAVRAVEHSLRAQPVVDAGELTSIRDLSIQLDTIEPCSADFVGESA